MPEQSPPKRRRVKEERAWLTKLIYSGREYEAYEDGFVIWKDRLTPVALSDFTARILEDVLLDDGVETSRSYRLEVILNHGKRHEEVSIDANEFSAMTWVDNLLGADATIYPGCREHVRTAIKRLSPKKLKRTVYRHIGWRFINDRAVYLHAAGAIGARGSVKGIDTQLSEQLRNYLLPDPPQGAELVEAVKASLKVLDVAPDRITFPVYSAIWRAKLRDCDLSVFPTGRTQSAKSELTALAQQHDGAAMTRKRLPANFSYTPNAIEMLAFEAKDALLTIDDFNPSGTAVEQQKLHAVAERIFRGQGNLAGRGRLTSDITLRPTKPPRGMYLASGEQVPKGHSLRARLVIVEMAPGDVNKHILTQCQADARNGLYAKVTAAFVRWLAPRIQESERMLIEEIAALRQAADDGTNILRRTPDNVYQLAAAFKIFLSFTVQLRILNKEAAASLWNRACAAYSDLIRAQDAQQESSDPTRQFFELLAGLIQSGEAHLAWTDGTLPSNAADWGWSQREGSWEAGGGQSGRLGWVDEDGIYLKPRATYNAIRRFAFLAGESAPLPCDTLWLRLKQSGLLASSGEKSRGTKFTIRHYCEGSRPDVLHIYLKTLALMTDPTDQTDPAQSGASVWSKFKTVLRRTDPRTDPSNDPKNTLQATDPTVAGQLGHLGQSLAQERDPESQGVKTGRDSASRNGRKPHHNTDPLLTQNLTHWQKAGFESADSFESWYESIYANHPTRGGLKAGRDSLAELVAEGTLQREAFETGYQGWRQSGAWTREGGRFIPKLSTFIQDKGWMFPPVEPSPAESNGANPEHRTAAANHGLSAAERRMERLNKL